MRANARGTRICNSTAHTSLATANVLEQIFVGWCSRRARPRKRFRTGKHGSLLTQYQARIKSRKINNNLVGKQIK